MVTYMQILGSSSKGISEWRKSTGSRRFALLGNDFFQNFLAIRLNKSKDT